MPYQFDWLVPEHVILIKVIDTLTRDDVGELVHLMTAAVAQSTVRLHAIYDISEMKRLPNLTLVTKETVGIFSKLGWIVAVGEFHSMLAFMLKTISQLGNCIVTTAPSIGEALEQLGNADLALARTMALNAARVSPS
jgi:hypothetical protein